jgi:ribonuclease BN (tRNA processing enzyme)
MPPSVIGQIAQEAHVKRLVLSHRMLPTLGKEDQSLSEISKKFLARLHLQTISTASSSRKVTVFAISTLAIIHGRFV